MARRRDELETGSRAHDAWSADEEVIVPDFLHIRTIDWSEHPELVTRIRKIWKTYKIRQRAPFDSVSKAELRKSLEKMHEDTLAFKRAIEDEVHMQIGKSTRGEKRGALIAVFQNMKSSIQKYDKRRNKVAESADALSHLLLEALVEVDKLPSTAKTKAELLMTARLKIMEALSDHGIEPKSGAYGPPVDLLMCLEERETNAENDMTSREHLADELTRLVKKKNPEIS